MIVTDKCTISHMISFCCLFAAMDYLTSLASTFLSLLV